MIAAEQGISYQAALKLLIASPPAGTVLAREVHTALAEAFGAAGWPVEVERILQCGGYLLYAGPARVEIRRPPADPADTSDYERDPDDSDADLSIPPEVWITAPLAQSSDLEVHLSATTAYRQIVAECSRQLAASRSRHIVHADSNADQACVICADRYPSGHLLQPRTSPELRTCPACVFDCDVIGPPSTLVLVYQLDQLEIEDLAIPAGWAGPVALLACLAAPGLVARAEALVREDGRIALPPALRWDDPADIWVWLPALGSRPAAFADLDVGARLGVLVEAVDSAHPDLREQVVTALVDDGPDELDPDEHDQSEADVGSGERERYAQALDQVWPAVVAYVVSFFTQACERPGERDPLTHVVESFDAVGDHCGPVLAATTDADLVSDLLPEALAALAIALGLPDPLRAVPDSATDNAPVASVSELFPAADADDALAILRQAKPVHGDVDAVLDRVVDLHGDDGPFGPLPRVPHGSQVRRFADEVRIALRGLGFEVADAGMEPLRDDIARRGHLVARVMCIQFPYSLRYLPSAEEYAAMVIGALPPRDPGKLHAIYPVPVNLWGTFTRAVPVGLDPAAIVGLADRYPLDWPCEVTGTAVLNVTLNEEASAYHLLLEIPSGSALARHLGLQQTDQ
ncbi:hypothetical protein GCM10010411_75500 [Actinomadura fulvescens]|uniref:Uncharacterized protein n=1 Tax=Actinomadura fulvescens TaxID=46160 RepID=A0ABN3QIF4_9ACTN